MAEFDAWEMFSPDENSEYEEDISTGLSSEEEYESICSQDDSSLSKSETSDFDDEPADDCQYLTSVDGGGDAELELASDTSSESKSTPSSCDLAVPLRPQASMDPLLCKNSVITETESCLLLLQYYLRHKLTTVAFQQLLSLVAIHLPAPNHFTKSLYLLKKFLIAKFPSYHPIQVPYCPDCLQLIDESAIVTCCEGKRNEFVVSDVGVQLQQKFKDFEFWNLLKSRPELPNTTCICDIYDGLMYAEHSHYGGFLDKRTNPANISFVLNTDGVSLFKSSCKDIWPIFLIINELPPSVRFSKKYTLLCGIWFGRDKPVMTTFLKPIVDQLNTLYKEGVKVYTPDGEMICRCMLLLCTSDLQARAPIANMKGFNGEYSCFTCNDKGDNTRGATSMNRYWPYNPLCTVRSMADVISAFTKAVNDGTAVRGYKGFPILALHSPFHLVGGMVTDYMHNVLIGVTKALLGFWFDDANKRELYSIYKHESDCTRMLSSIKVPDFIKRPPRRISDKGHWKATELQNWFLFYSVPILDGILPRPYFIHYCKLIQGVSILLGSHITPGLLNVAESSLKDFYKDMEEFYGPTSVSMNIHQLRHLVYHVKNFGPLWVYSCFSFESRNGDLKRLFHGTKNMSNQVLFSYIAILNQCLPKLEEVEDMSPIAKELMKELTQTRNIKKTRQFEGGWQSGPSDFITVSTLPDCLKVFQPNHAYKFYMLHWQHLHLAASEYSYRRASARVNSYIKFKSSDDQILYACVLYFIALQIQECQWVPFAAVSVIEVSLVEVLSPATHLQKVSREEVSTMFIKPCTIIDRCLLFSLNGTKYLAYYPNKIISLLDM